MVMQETYKPNYIRGYIDHVKNEMGRACDAYGWGEGIV